MSGHECPCGCGKTISVNRLSCRPSWYALPKELRQRIWDAYGAGDRNAHADLITEAIDLIREKGNAP